MAEPAQEEETIVAVKGFDQNLRCRNFQFAIGQTYEHDGPVEICASGFHACEYPLDAFGYYAPATSRYALVTQSGALARHSDDTKIASAKIMIEAELHLPDLIDRAIKWVFDRAKPEGKGSSATGDSGAASATGARGRAMGAEGCALFLVYPNPNNGAVAHAWAGIAGRDGIKPLIWHTLDETGKPIEVA